MIEAIASQGAFCFLHRGKMIKLFLRGKANLFT